MTSSEFHPVSKERAGGAGGSHSPALSALPRLCHGHRPPQAGPREFARGLTEACKQLLKRDLRAHGARIRRTSLGEFLSHVEEPSCCFGLELCRRLRGRVDTAGAWVEITPVLAFAAIRRLLGALAEPIPQRPLTAVEHHLLERTVERVIADIGRTFGHARSLRVSVRPELIPSDICEADAAVAAVTFAVSLDRCDGAIRVCLPPEFVSGEGAAVQTSGSRGGPLELFVTAPDTGIPAEDLAALTPGDVLVTDLPADGEVIIRVGGIPKFAGQLGMVHGRRAVVITRRLC